MPRASWRAQLAPEDCCPAYPDDRKPCSFAAVRCLAGSGFVVWGSEPAVAASRGRWGALVNTDYEALAEAAGYGYGQSQAL